MSRVLFISLSVQALRFSTSPRLPPRQRSALVNHDNACDKELWAQLYFPDGSYSSVNPLPSSHTRTPHHLSLSPIELTISPTSIDQQTVKMASEQVRAAGTKPGENMLWGGRFTGLLSSMFNSQTRIDSR